MSVGCRWKGKLSGGRQNRFLIFFPLPDIFFKYMTEWHFLHSATQAEEWLRNLVKVKHIFAHLMLDESRLNPPLSIWGCREVSFVDFNAGQRKCLEGREISTHGWFWRLIWAETHQECFRNRMSWFLVARAWFCLLMTVVVLNMCGAYFICHDYPQWSPNI